MSASKLIRFKPGMVLPEDVRNFSGQLLLSKGTKLTPKCIKYLKAWGLDAIQQAVSTPATNKLPHKPEVIDPGQLAEAQAEALAAAAKLFQHTDKSHPATKELMRLCAAKKLNKETEMEGAHGS